MPNFQFIVSNPTARKAYKIEIDQDKAIGLVGKIIGQKFNGGILGLSGYELQITGGTDKDGFPMHPQVHGPGRKKVVLAFPPGFHPKMKGQRKRKMVRGNTVSRDIRQINCKVIKPGAKPLDQLIKKEEKPKEEEVEKEEKPEKEIEEKKEKPKEKPKKEVPKEELKKEEIKPAEKPKKEAKKEKKKPKEGG